MSAALAVYRAVWRVGAALRVPALVLRGRPAELGERCGLAPETGSGGEPLWLHAASVGEIGAAHALVRELRADEGRRLAVSTMTRTGRERAEDLAPDVGPFHIPLDAPAYVRRCLDRLRPSALVLLETELWPNLLLELGRRGTPWAIASGRMTGRSLRRPGFVRAVFRKVLSTAAAVGARTEGDAERFVAMGARPAAVRVTGDLKEDRPVAARVPSPDDRPRWIAACTRPGEEEIAIGAARRVAASVPAGELVLAPRHPERFEDVVSLAARSGWPVRRWQDRDRPGPSDGWSVLVVDAMGVLDEAYRRSRCAFVGGSLRPFGGHSPREAAVVGRPVLLGPHTEHCADLATALVSAGAARRVTGEEDLAAAVEMLLRDDAEAERRGRAAHATVAVRSGAAARTIDLLRARGVLG